ncbi:MAG: hypothetical protein A3B68_08780 [Candidatus Melainabacteria bacterium RIFCSPHIGHO2_02_FULL_34_12]|nr:MAG: hypothetical protein A3B68_08780 [Candidatus Melainabacteria bacterium RIFCSPHIGHO2_02_FULL_34_12]
MDGVVAVGKNIASGVVGTRLFNPGETEAEQSDFVFPKFNNFCRAVNGYVEGEEINEEQYSQKHNYLCLRDITKAIWPLYLPLQVAGLFSDRAEKIARGFYGACWSIVYSCYRPWKHDVKKLADGKEEKPIPGFFQGLNTANEYFRAIAGTAVSAIYGGGAFGMLWGAITGNNDFFNASAKVYQTGMFNQNPVFASMNAAIEMRRTWNKKQLDPIDSERSNFKGGVEIVDTILFIPNIITRTLATLKLFGLNLMNEGMERFVNFLGYFSYGTWATRFGIMKTGEKKQGGDLEDIKHTAPVFYHAQDYGGTFFKLGLSTLSWISAGAELLGFREMAEKVFKLEGILERLNPAIASWCLTNPWLQGYLRTHEPSPEIKGGFNPT